MIHKLSVLLAGPLVALALLAAGPALADSGDGSSGSSGTSGSSNNSGASTGDGQTRRCFFGRVWDASQGRCVQPSQQDSSLGQDEIFAYGRVLAEQGHFEDAIAVLVQAPDQTDPRVLNMLGFSSRKLDRMDEALAYYRQAVATDPDFVLVREYLGEAYVQLGQLERAREQLTEIERICGSRTCAQYSMLANMIVDTQTQ